MEGINSKSCLKALHIRIQELIQQEIDIMYSRLGPKFWKKRKYAKSKLLNELSQCKTGDSTDHLNPIVQPIDQIAMLRRPIQTEQERLTQELLDR